MYALISSAQIARKERRFKMQGLLTRTAVSVVPVPAAFFCHKHLIDLYLNGDFLAQCLSRAAYAPPLSDHCIKSTTTNLPASRC
jgi:hypothetical protein